MDYWILIVLILILLELMWIASRLGVMTEKGGLQEELLSELKEIREELYWFKDDKLAGHFFKEIDSGVERVLQGFSELKEELCWFKDDKFAGYLFKEIDSGVERVLQSLDRIHRSLNNVDDRLAAADSSLDNLKEIVPTLERIAEDLASR